MSLSNTFTNAFTNASNDVVVGNTQSIDHDQPKRQHHSARTKFTEEEDCQLKVLVDKYGESDWQSISNEMVQKTSRQCRERFMNYLRPSLNLGEWTPEEEQLLENQVLKIGQKWSLLTKFFENRSDVNIKNHWAKMQNQKLKKAREQLLSTQMNQYSQYSQYSQLMLQQQMQFQAQMHMQMQQQMMLMQQPQIFNPQLQFQSYQNSLLQAQQQQQQQQFQFQQQSIQPQQQLEIEIEIDEQQNTEHSKPIDFEMDDKQDDFIFSSGMNEIDPVNDSFSSNSSFSSCDTFDSIWDDAGSLLESTPSLIF